MGWLNWLVNFAFSKQTKFEPLLLAFQLAEEGYFGPGAFLLPATVRRLPRRVRAFVRVR